MGSSDVTEVITTQPAKTGFKPANPLNTRTITGPNYKYSYYSTGTENSISAN